mmetsp:Transcript_8875/g.25795  ORF Transcript_8875/g.25795 Transcript_8875/m.25795 type:complete len:754 (-) Transcript_8875:60-2321(-)
MSATLLGKVQRIVELETDSPEMLEALDAVSHFYTEREAEAGAGGDGRRRSGGAINNSNTNNPSKSRHTLRSELSRKNYVLACQFLQGLDRIRERLEAAQGAVVALEDGSARINTRIQAASDSMLTFLDEATALEAQRNDLRAQATKIEAFLEQYQLSEAEIAALHREPIEANRGDTFFSALERLDVIRVETNRLVGSEHQGTGFELLDALSAHQEKAFARLYAWVQDQVGNLDSEAAEADPVIQKAVKTLYATPTFYKHCQDIVISVRRATVVKNFVAALSYQPATEGDHVVSRKIRPLDIHANDPVRYASDMLAWAHQAVVTERELVRSLFQASQASMADGRQGQPEAKGETNAPASEGEGEDEDAAAAAADATPLTNQRMLREIMEGLGHPLEMRVSQIVESGGGSPLDAFKLSGLLAFYHVTLVDVLGDDSAVVLAIQSCRENMYKSFLQSLTCLGKEVGEHIRDCLGNISGSTDHQTAGAREASVITLDLQPSAALKEMLRTLSSILRTSRTALTPPSEQEADVSPILEAFLLPFAAAQRDFLGRMAQERSEDQQGDSVARLFSDTSSDEAIFLMNCFISAVRILEAEETQLVPHSPDDTLVAEKSRAAVEHWSGVVREGIPQLRRVVVDYHSRRVLDRTGLGSVLAARDIALAGGDAGTALSTYPTLSAEAVQVVVEAFNAALFTIFVADYERITDPDEKNEARIDTMKRVAEGYEVIWDMVTDDANQYSDRSFLVHTPDQVRILLDV